MTGYRVPAHAAHFGMGSVVMDIEGDRPLDSASLLPSYLIAWAALEPLAFKTATPRGSSTAFKERCDAQIRIQAQCYTPLLKAHEGDFNP